MQVMTTKFWSINDSIIPLQDRVGLLYKIWAYPKPDAPFAKWQTGYVCMRMLTLPDIDATLAEHLLIAQRSPTDFQLLEMKEALKSLNQMTTKFEQDWRPRDSYGKLNRRMVMRMWRKGWRGPQKESNDLPIA